MTNKKYTKGVLFQRKFYYRRLSSPELLNLLLWQLQWRKWESGNEQHNCWAWFMILQEQELIKIT